MYENVTTFKDMQTSLEFYKFQCETERKEREVLENKYVLIKGEIIIILHNLGLNFYIFSQQKWIN